MAEPLPLPPATDATGPLPGRLNLTLTEEFQRVHSAGAASRAAFEAELKASGIPLPFGTKHQQKNALFLRHWPSGCWIVGEVPDNAPGPYLTDISHAQVSLLLDGPMAMQFLENHSSSDLRIYSRNGTNTLRTRIGPYPVVLFWNSASSIHVLVDRSNSQSLVSNIKFLAVRNTA